MTNNDNRKTLPSTEGPTTLETIGTVAIVATTLTVAVIIIAPRLTLAAIGGALTGLGSRLLKSSFEGR